MSEPVSADKNVGDDGEELDKSKTTNDEKSGVDNVQMNASQDLNLDDSQKENESLAEVNTSNAADQDGESNKQSDLNPDATKPTESKSKPEADEMEPETGELERGISNSSDEVIECTPPEELKKALMSSPSGVLKRKGEEVDTVAPKLPKINSTDKIKEKLDDGETFEEISESLAQVLNEEKMDSDSVKSKSDDSKELSMAEDTGTPIVSDESINKEEVNDTIEELSVIPQVKTSNTASRHSIEVIYDKSKESKPTDFIDLLDSSHEDNIRIDKSDASIDKLITNGNKSVDFKMNDHSFISDRSNLNSTKNMDTLVSDIENESFDDKSGLLNKSKMMQVEKESTFLVKIKYLLQIDSNTKEIISKEMLTISCDTPPAKTTRTRTSSTRNRTSDGVFGDVSDDKDGSPGSVSSNIQLYSLPSRLSLASIISSSSASSSSSKSSNKDNLLFSLPKYVPKQKKDDEVFDKVKKEWKNAAIITPAVINYMNSEVINNDLFNGTGSNQEIISSTPEINMNNDGSIDSGSECYKPSTSLTTPKSSKKGKVKRTRSTNKSSNNDLNKLTSSASSAARLSQLKEEGDRTNDNMNDSLTDMLQTTPLLMNLSATTTPRSLSILRNQMPNYDPSDAYVGKKCFAKWNTDYYPGKVVGKLKDKLKVLFLDDKTKTVHENFVVIIPDVLPIHLGVYALEGDEDFGTCGEITAVDDSENDVVYTVTNTDEAREMKVTLKEIFLSEEQIKQLRVSVHFLTGGIPPYIGIRSQDIADSSSRAKSSGSTTPKGKGRPKGSKKRTSPSKPSDFGLVSPRAAKYESSDDISDQNVPEPTDILGEIASEIPGKSKGPQSRMKGKARSKKRDDDDETINTLGPIPPEGSTIFKGMKFILSYAGSENFDKNRMKSERKTRLSDYMSKSDSDSRSDRESELYWTTIQFDRDRLEQQIVAGGGFVYQNFKDIPPAEYKNVNLISNIPNVTEKSLLCLSVGIGPVNHYWIIESCKKNILQPRPNHVLPVGWSSFENRYVDMKERITNKPFNLTAIIIPRENISEESLEFWKTVIENAGGKVRFVSKSDNFCEATVIITTKDYPMWIKEKSLEYGDTPIQSTDWIVQCLIAGKIIEH